MVNVGFFGTPHMSHSIGSFTPIRLIMAWYIRITAYVIVLYLFSGNAETQTEAERCLNIGTVLCPVTHFYLLSMENQALSNA
jgi:hypothetical protein